MSSFYAVRRLCLVLGLHYSGYYQWLKRPQSLRARQDERQTGLIKQLWLESGTVYGYRKIWQDIKELGEHAGRNRIARLMRLAELASQTGYRKRRYYGGGKPSVASPNYLERQFIVPTPNTHWVSDMTYIRTHECWLYLAVVLDLFSRRVIGWSMGGRMTAELVMDALLMAVWRRKPAAEVLIHSDQGSQYTSERCQHFMTAHNLKSSMSRRGNCHDNAVAESFFQLLKRERIKKRIYKNREEAKADIFDYVEMFYNAKRRHSACEDQPPAVYESAWFMRHATV